MAKPLLRWAGSKQQLVGELASYWDGNKSRYVEPFAGSARLFFRLEPERALLGDINAGLISTYCEIQRGPEQVHRFFSRWENSSDKYYELRAKDPETLGTAERAARFIYLNRFCFNGLYRTNLRGEFNVPYGGAKTGRLPTLKRLEKIATLLKRATIMCADFVETVAKAEAGDFVYMDPPFSVSERRVFREYDATDFCDTDLVRLRKCLVELDTKGTRFVLSYDDSEEGETLAEGFGIRRVSTRRNIAGFSGSRRVAQELLISNVGV
ncbi:MAG: Dam family site-specific DNA-(adenine-N6)-methyltransferase [Rhodospirillales bacterium]|nr:Dam family site-specific DNA-(adenine-N6)-methyltransferase [Rhodospirillales bacterium]